MRNSARLALFLLVLGLALPAEPAAQGTRAGEVTALLPTARVERGGAAGADLRLNDAVFWRDWVETAVRARARLALDDGSLLNLGSGARLQVLRHDQTTQQTELELKFGKVRAVVQKVTRPDGRFEVRTETAVVGVIGTHVYVDAAAALTTAINFEGSVRVRSTDPTITGEEILAQFELAEIEPGQPIRKRLATLEELLRALEDTLPGLTIRLQPQQARAGSCVSAVTSGGLAATGGRLVSAPFLEVTPRACATPELAPVRVCVPEDAAPGAYEYAARGADGVTRWGAFLVQPAAPLQEARLLTLPELPPGATHYGRLVGRDDEPLPGVPIRVRKDGQEETIYTDENGGFTVQAPESGKLELEVARDAGSEESGPLAAPLPPIRQTIAVADTLEADSTLPEFSQRGGAVNVPGELRGARLGDRTLPVLRTVTRAGRQVSSVAIPPAMPEGPAPLELEDPAGNRRSQPLLVYEILSAQLDQRSLMSGNQTEGEFLVCVGSTDDKNMKVRALIFAVGPVRFRGKGGKGKTYRRTFGVEPNGLLRIPFEIQAEKGAPGAGIPFTLTLRLEGG